MANLHQLNISYNPGEDRLLLKVTARDGENFDEFRLWLTRRFVLLLWQSLEREMIETVAADPAVAEADQASLFKFQEEAALQQADFSTPYSPPVDLRTPLGEVPFLATRIRLQRQPENHHILSLQDENGLGINLVLDETMLHSLRKLLQDGVRMAQWGLNLRTSSDQSGEQATATEPRFIQ